MDLVEISYNDEAAAAAEKIPGHPIYNWSKTKMITNYLKSQGKTLTELTIDDTYFTLGDHRFIELYDGKFKEEPDVELDSVGGRFTTSVMIVNYNIVNGKLAGKICIRAKNGQPLYSEYQIVLKKAKLKMIVGLEFFFQYNHCIYEFSDIDLTIVYYKNSKIISVFDTLNQHQKDQLKTHLMEYITKDMLPGILSEQELLTRSYNADDHFNPQISNICIVHIRRLHKAFNDLAKRIVTLTNEFVKEDSLELTLSKVFGFKLGANLKNTIKLYEGFIGNLDTLAIVKNKNVIVSKENELVVIYIPVEYQEINLHYREIKDKDKKDGDFTIVQGYRTEDAYICVTLKRLSEKKVELQLRQFKITRMRPNKNEKELKIITNYAMLHEIEDSIKSFIEEVLEDDELQNLAINQVDEIEYCNDDFFIQEEGSSSEEKLQSEDEESRESQ